MTDAERNAIIEKNHALVKDWEPGRVFPFFAELAALPHGSGNCKAVAEYLEAFAAKEGLSSKRDAAGNIILKKGAQNSQAKHGVILQAHQDMVCVKTPGNTHDFTKDPLTLQHNGDWLVAEGTTLGADDGIGVAIALAILADKTLPHPPLEALFTVDEETDMKGAKAVNPSDLEGTTLINLDAEDLNIAYISSAAGASSRMTIPLTTKKSTAPLYRNLCISGLLGGHSGIDINRVRANAYVLLARALHEIMQKFTEKGWDISLHSFEQGEGHGADNAVPDRAKALLGLPSEEAAALLTQEAARIQEIFRNEYRASDKGCTVLVEQAEKTQSLPPALDAQSCTRLLDVVRLLPLGIIRFIQIDALMDGIPYKDLLVESSCNLGIAAIAEGEARLTLLARSSTASVLEDFMLRLEGLARLAGGTLTVTNRTQGWEMPATLSPVQELFKKQGLHLSGVHAGLECGCLVDAFERAGKKLDAIAIGPDLKDVHSPKERLSISTVQSLWKQLTNVLAELP